MPKRLPFALVCLALVAAVSPSGPSLEAQSSCSVPTQNRFVRDALVEYHYWNRELPSLNPATFASPQAYLEAVRYKPLDATYSFIASRADQDALYSASQFVGLGMTTPFDGVEMRVSEVFPDSPASEAGLKRGDRFLTVNGRTVADIAAADEIATAFGPHEEGLDVVLEWRPLEGPDRKATLKKRVVTIPPVQLTKLYEVDGRKVGYIVFRNFVEPSVAALDESFTALRDAGATELVLDMRYNGGGLVSVAQHLASLIGGERTNGQVLAEYVHNDRHRELNSKLLFQAKPNALNLTRLVVITTRASASASELIINGLRPYIPVTVVGDRTYGKPVGPVRPAVLRQGPERRVLRAEERAGRGRLLQRPAGDVPGRRRARASARRRRGGIAQGSDRLPPHRRVHAGRGRSDGARQRPPRPLRRAADRRLAAAARRAVATAS